MTARLAHLARLVVGGLLGLALLGWVAENHGSPTGEVVVHVAERDVELTIGGDTYRIASPGHDPIISELPAGRHRMTLRRGERVLCEESFELRDGESRVLTVWDPARLRAGTASGAAPIIAAPGRRARRRVVRSTVVRRPRDETIATRER